MASEATSSGPAPASPGRGTSDIVIWHIPMITLAQLKKPNPDPDPVPELGPELGDQSEAESSDSEERFVVKLHPFLLTPDGRRPIWLCSMCDNSLEDNSMEAYSFDYGCGYVNCRICNHSMWTHGPMDPTNPPVPHQHQFQDGRPHDLSASL